MKQRAPHDDRRQRRLADGARPFGATMAALALVLSACGGNGDGDATAGTESFEPADAVSQGSSGGSIEADAGATADAMAEAPSEGDSDGAAEGEATPASSGGAQTAGVTAADLNRQIIFTATVEVDVDDVATAGLEAVDAVERAGGFVFGQESTGGAEPRSVFVFKVRPADFDAALTALDGIGELRNQVISADDVTERVVDLESRIQVAELGVERLRAAMEGATNLTDFAELERLLLDRETELEVMRGQIRTLQDQVDLATITLVLTQDRIENNLQLTVTTYEEHNDGVTCPGQPDNRVEAGTDLTVCFELVNTGDQALADLTLTDTGLGIDEGTGLIAVYGGLDDVLQPGQSIIVAFESSADRDLRMRTVATGRPVAIEGQDPAGPPVSTIRNTTVGVTPSTDAPGFGDGFDSGKVVLSGIWSAVRVTVGFVLPLLVLLPFLIGAGWLLRRWSRRPGRKTARPAVAFDSTPPPPVTPAAPAAPVPAEPVPAEQATDAADPAPPAAPGDAPA